MAVLDRRKYHRLADVHDKPKITVEDIYLLRHAFERHAARPRSIGEWRKETLRRHCEEVRAFVGHMMGLEDLWDGRDVAHGKALAAEMRWVVGELDIASRPRDGRGTVLWELADVLERAMEEVLVRVARLEQAAK
jgi:hypothetical protein